MDLISQIRTNNEKYAKEAVETSKHNDLVQMQLQTQQVIVQSVSSLVDYLQGRVSKTEVVNQLQEIGTPDVRYVVDALNDLHSTLKTHENVDLSELTSLVRSMLEETKQIPKSLPEQKEQKFVDYSGQLKKVELALTDVTKAIKAQKTTVEAPVVNVPAPHVNVEAPDLTPLQTDVKGVTTAVKAIRLPEVIDGAAAARQINTLIQEKFDGYKITYDSFGETDQIESIAYMLGKKVVATVSFAYDGEGRLVGARKK